jgi:hypothetical protein
MSILPDAAAARLLSPQRRQWLALDALSGVPLSHLADRHHVSRKFVYRQQRIAQKALDAAFSPPPPPDQRVLFYLPITKAWIKQFILALILIGHCSIRGTHEILRDLFDFHRSVGAIHALVQHAATKAKAINASEDLSRVRAAAPDEIFQGTKPVLAVVDVFSTYCCLLEAAEHRDGDTWGVALLDLRRQGFAPDSTIADGGKGLRAGVKAALPGVPCHADNWHALRDFGEAVRFLENRAYDAMTAADKLQRQLSGRPNDGRLQERTAAALLEQGGAIDLADGVALLATWLRRDVLSLAGPALERRRELFDFVLIELLARRSRCEHRLGPVCTMLDGQQEDLLGFCVRMDVEVADLALYAKVSEAVVREMIATQEMAGTNPRRWQREGALRKHLGERYEALSEHVGVLRAGVVRASSVVENVNSRLRNYFFLRKEVGGDYLELLRFFLNHRRFLRSEHPERVGKSPAELLSGQGHPHWLEMLGHQLFSQAA